MSVKGWYLREITALKSELGCYRKKELDRSPTLM